MAEGVVEVLGISGESNRLSTPEFNVVWIESEVSTFGPVVDGDGNLVGLNAGVLPPGRDAVIGMVPLADVRPAIDGLLDGENGTWIGLSDWGVMASWAGLRSIQIGRVQPASPAALAGFETDDLILDMGGVAMAVDITKRAYCEVLQASDPAVPVPVTAYRPLSGELLAGEIYGEPLEVVGTLEDYVAPVPTLADGDVTTDLIDRPLAIDWYTLTSPDGNLRLEVPANWRFRTDSKGRTLVFTAAPNLANYDALSDPDDPPFVATGLTVRIFRVSTNSRLDAYDLDDHVQAELGHATFERCQLESHDSLFDFPEEITAAGAMRRHTCQTV
ncbi:MAG: S1C family serine protease [Chloroflexota bacterium]|nr:S1C family serine protease [Chloroflexota bacterium]